MAGSPANRPAAIYYWHRESPGSNAEVDYVISSETTIFGIEVKAATSGRMQSLWKFLEDDVRRKGVRISHENCSAVDNVRIVPLYAAQMVARIV